MNRKRLCCVLALLLCVIMLFGCVAAQSAAAPSEPAQNEAPPSAAEQSAPIESAEPAQAESLPEEAPETAEASGSWVYVTGSASDYDVNIEGFLNESFGITAGRTGETHYTTDGGKTWPRSENMSMCRFSIDIVDENLVWNGGNGSQIRVSKDGGKTYSAVTDLPLGGSVSNLDFIDEITGWACTTGKCASTADGGMTWTPMTLPEEAKGIAALSLRTPADGYIFSRNGLFLTTHDGGATWDVKDVGMADYKVVDEKNEPGLYKFSAAVADIAFTDEQNGTLVFTGIVPGEGTLVWCLKTQDGGAQWTAEQVAVPQDFKTSRLYLSADGKYLTLGSFSKDMILFKAAQ